MDSSLFTRGLDGDHNDISFMEISNIFVIGLFSLKTAPFDSAYNKTLGPVSQLYLGTG